MSLSSGVVGGRRPWRVSLSPRDRRDTLLREGVTTLPLATAAPAVFPGQLDRDLLSPPKQPGMCPEARSVPWPRPLPDPGWFRLNFLLDQQIC